jgi:hypothetical protein
LMSKLAIVNRSDKMLDGRMARTSLQDSKTRTLPARP